MRETKITPLIARTLLRYAPSTGRLTWKERNVYWFDTPDQARRWNTRYAGREAFTSMRPPGPTRQGTLLGENHLAGRIIWLIMTGAWPRGVIIKRNGRPDDYRWSNLRDVERRDIQRRYRHGLSDRRHADHILPRA